MPNRGRNSIVRFLFGDNCPAGRRLAGAAIGLLLLAIAATALTFLNFGNELVSVRADTDGQNVSCSDSLTGEPGSQEAQDNPDSDPYYGHLYIDSAQEGTSETGERDGTSAELCHLSFELYPDEETTDTSVTLYGMMPEGATAEVVDVTQQYPDADDVSEETTEDATVVAAYNITISDGEDEFQPNESRPIRVEISSTQA